MPPAVAAQPGRRDQRGEELRLRSEGGRERGAEAVAAVERGQRRGEEQRAHGVVVAAARNLDERERAPGEHEQPLAG